MQPAPIPKNEKERLQAVSSLGLLDTKPEKRFDDITTEALQTFHVPISTISILDKDTEWFKSYQGLPDTQGERSISFCGHALLSQIVMVVEDTLLDERFFDNPNVISGPKIRFYAGVCLREKKTHSSVGVLCIKDTKPRKFSAEDVDKLMSLGKKAEEEINITTTQ